MKRQTLTRSLKIVSVPAEMTMEDEREAESRKDIEVAPALIAVHPDEHCIAVAVGPDLRVFDLL